ncbi:phasin family protein [Thalassospira lucentensis]|uniref:phasin family protein n=1 Tax=Thalassospira lucentensis TaxID=168935 RepID=UPI0003B3B0CE|nr:phasin family protein [Thalassospira lucentensis]
MAVSKPKASGKSQKTSVAAKKNASTPSTQTSGNPNDVVTKRVVMTSSEIEAAAKKPDDISSTGASAAKPDASASKDKAHSAEDVKLISSASSSEKADQMSVANTPDSASVVKVDADTGAEVKASPAEASTTATRAKAPATSSPASKQSKPVKSAPKPAAKSGAARSAAAKKPASKKMAASKPSPKAEKVSTVTQTTKSAAAAKPADAKVTVPKKTAAPAKAQASASKSSTTQKTVAPSSPPKLVPQKESQAPATASSPKPAAKEAPEGAPSDVFGMGVMFMDTNAMEKFFDMWKTPEVDAIFTASNDAFEGSISAANEAFSKMFETMTGQSDVFSGAGSRVVAQYEELIETQQKNLEEIWHASAALMEKSGGVGTELVAWAQREMDASQADIEALSKAESLSDIQEVNARILNRCVESGLAEGEKVQEMMFSALSDSFSAMNKAANVGMK